MLRIIFNLFAFALMVLFFSVFLINRSYASGVILGGTRVIFNAEDKAAELSLKNTDEHTFYLVQSWVENFTPGNDQVVPFVVIPPLFRIDPGKENILRIKSIPNSLPADRESMFWLNVKSIAGTENPQNNVLQINIDSKIKLIYRPAGLTLQPDEIQAALKIEHTKKGIKIINPTPFFVNFYSILINGKSVEHPGIIPPFERVEYSSEQFASKVVYQILNDFGAVSEKKELHF